MRLKPASVAVGGPAHFEHGVHADGADGRGTQCGGRMSRRPRSSPYVGETMKGCANGELHSEYCLPVGLCPGIELTR